MDKIYTKLLNNITLSKDEIKLLENKFIYFILNNKTNNIINNLIHLYSIRYLNIEGSPSSNKIILLCFDFVNEINKKYNKNYLIEFSNKKFTNIHAFVKINELPHTITLNTFTFLRDYKLTKILPHLNIKMVSFFLIYTILHEFGHCMQDEYTLCHNNQITDTYFKEHIVMLVDRKFYFKNHQFFTIEQESDIFALNEVRNFYSIYFKEDNEFENNMLNKYYSVYIKPYIDRDNFLKEFDEIYSMVEKEFPELIKDNKKIISDNKIKKLNK